jgi:hypothetical protein
MAIFLWLAPRTPDLKRCSKNVLNCENKSDEENGVRGGSPAEKKMAF